MLCYWMKTNNHLLFAEHMWYTLIMTYERLHVPYRICIMYLYNTILVRTNHELYGLTCGMINRLTRIVCTSNILMQQLV